VEKQGLFNRWEVAQKSEKEYWEEFDKERLIKEEINRHKVKAKIVEEELKKVINLDKKSKILQIGCGPEDIINYFSVGELYAIDPLADFYKEKFKLNYGNVHFSQARAEKLPFEDNFFDVVILSNVLDHVEYPSRALEEIKRVLKKGGVFYFENLFYQRGFIFLSKIWAPVKKTITGELFNVHHPHMFQLKDLKSFLLKDFLVVNQQAGKEIGLYENIDELKEMKQKEKKITSKMLSHIGIYGTINYSAICKKRD
jgi:ubiquinone/menaquinone biosynthesis C-methylase UbiE